MENTINLKDKETIIIIAQDNIKSKIIITCDSDKLSVVLS